jgi:Fibronectin type III domain
MNEATHQIRQTRAALAGAAAVAVALAALLWPAGAEAQTRPLRDRCLDPTRTLNVLASGGSATFEAREPLLGCVSGGPATFRVKDTCTFHCQHWHTWVPTGTPQRANVQLRAVPAPGSFLVAWSGNCTPRLGQPRSDCTVRVASSPTTVTAVLSPVQDMIPPSPPNPEVPSPSSYTAVIRWSPSTDENGVAGYDVFRAGVEGPVARAGGGATSVTVTNLRCETAYSFHVEAFDASGNAAPSAPVSLQTGRCGPTTRPNTSLHVGPPKRTTRRSAYFHWGANRTPVTYQCKLDRGRWTSCRPGKRYRNLKKGWHTFQVRAKDAGGVDPTPAKRRWRIV